MLVLTRRANESIVIGDDITVTILGVTPGGVRIGIDAPREMRVHRAEIVLAVQDANQEAVAAAASGVSEESLLNSLRGTPRPD